MAEAPIKISHTQDSRPSAHPLFVPLSFTLSLIDRDTFLGHLLLEIQPLNSINHLTWIKAAQRTRLVPSMIPTFTPGPLHGGRKSIEVPREAIGYVIGEDGFTIKHVQTSTGARIVSPAHNTDTTAPGKFCISGKPEAVDLALGNCENVIGTEMTMTCRCNSLFTSSHLACGAAFQRRASATKTYNHTKPVRELFSTGRF